MLLFHEGFNAANNLILRVMKMMRREGRDTITYHRTISDENIILTPGGIPSDLLAEVSVTHLRSLVEDIAE